jgi:hypothetical protein
MSTDKQYWFRAKRYGWGWGLPCSWQGWIFFIIWFVILMVAVQRLMPEQPVEFTAALALMALILALVCHFKGEPPTRGGSAKTLR